MKKIITIIAILISSSFAIAGPNCTSESKDKWQKEDAFQKILVTEGYKIKKFKVTKGNCYEIYGWNKAGQKVEIYFNPVDGKIIKEEIR